MGTTGVDGVGGAGTGLIEVTPGTQPLVSFDSGAWVEVTAECEDQLPSEVEFQIAADGRVVALNMLGEPVCTDTVEDVRDELAELGRAEEASSLAAAYLVTIGLALPGEGWDGADPSPQPSSQPDMPGTGMRLGSAPADEVEEADPSPQPS